jgi:hypothetical protein
MNRNKILAGAIQLKNNKKKTGKKEIFFRQKINQLTIIGKSFAISHQSSIPRSTFVLSIPNCFTTF